MVNPILACTAILQHFCDDYPDVEAIQCYSHSYRENSNNYKKKLYLQSPLHLKLSFHVRAQ